MTITDARAEPAAAEAGAAPDASGHTHEAACLNCRTALAGDFCHACGQRAHVHRTLGAFFHDLLHGVLHFEGRTWRTLPMLAWRPGELTRRYIQGERTRFVSPLALFLFSVFLMFAVFTSIGGPLTFDGQSLSSPEEIRRMQQQSVELESREQSLKREQARLEAAGQPTQAVEAQLREVTQGRQAIAAGLRLVGAPRPGEEAGVDFDFSGVTADTGWKWLDKAIEKGAKNPSLMLYKLQANAYKFSWLLIPISVPFVWLLFLWRRRHWQLYDHTVFVTYSLSFQSLTVILFTVLARIGVSSDFLLVTFGLVASLHIYRQFRGAYGLGRFSAVWRVLALTFMIGVALLLFGLALIALGATG